MNNSTNNNIIHLHPQEDDFKVLYQMLNSTEQIRRRQIRRETAHRMMLRRKTISLAKAFLAGAVFMAILTYLISLA